jgi:hypothetical protein
MAKKKRAGRPKGSKNKKARSTGRPSSGAKYIDSGTFSGQIQILQTERKKLLSNVKRIDKAISILRKLD